MSESTTEDDFDRDGDSAEVAVDGKPTCAVCGISTEKEPCMIHMPRAWGVFNAENDPTFQ